MRITSGQYRGRKLFCPDGMNTRPTSDRVREALFNILLHHDWGDKIGDPLRDAHVIDGFAGTGALGLEALSRGAAHTTFIERDRKALESLRQNIAHLGCAESTNIIGMDIARLSPREGITPCSLIFLDPPYNKDLVVPALTSLNECGYIAENALLCVETAKKETIELPETHTHYLSRIYGDTAVHFYVTV